MKTLIQFVLASALVLFGLEAKSAVNLYQTNSGGSFKLWGQSIGTVPSAYPYTLSAWLKASVTNTLMNCVTLSCTTNSNIGTRIRIAAGGAFSLNSGDSGSTSSTTGSDVATLGEWHHVVGIFLDSSNRLLYVNGRFSAGTTNGSIRNSLLQDVLVIGGGRPITNTFTSSPATVEVAKVGLWSVALSEEEIKSMSSAPNRIPRLESLIDFYELEHMVPKLGVESGKKGSVIDFIHTTYFDPAPTNGVWTTPGPTGRPGL